MQLARLCAVALIHEYNEIAFHAKVRWQRILDFFQELLVIAVSNFTATATELVNQRTNDGTFGRIQTVQQIATALGANNLFFHTLEQLLYLVIELIAVRDNQNPAARIVQQKALGKPDHRERFARTLRVPDNTALLLRGNPVVRAVNCVILIVAADLLYTIIKNDKVMNQI